MQSRGENALFSRQVGKGSPASVQGSTGPLPNLEDDPHKRQQVPLFTDLDGTLATTDVSVEASFILIRRNLLYALALPFWLLRGKAQLKREVSGRVPLDAAHLPYIEDFVAFLREEHAAGRRLILATAADETYGRAVADHLGIFDDVIGSDGRINLEDQPKLAKIQEMTGGGPFDYAGNDIADLTIFPKARKAIIVHPVPAVRQAAETMANVDRHFAGPARGLDRLFSALRLERAWMNLLVVLPFLKAEESLAESWFLASFAVFAFTLASSAASVFDDLLHLEKHRHLPPAARGAIACGEVAIQRAASAIALLWGMAILLAALLSGPFAAVIAGYSLASVLFVQDWLRCPRVLAAMALAAFRVFAGAALLATTPALWMITLALGLGACTEILRRHKLGFY